MTTSFTQPQPSTRSGPSTAVGLTIAVVAGIAAFTFVMAGITFIGLAIAFPIAVPVAEAYHLPVSVADAALAERFAAFWWVFAGFALASFATAGVIVVKLIGFLSPGPRD
jgi:hypothetical protein